MITTPFDFRARVTGEQLKAKKVENKRSLSWHDERISSEFYIEEREPPEQ
jgi:hypothetical protein